MRAGSRLSVIAAAGAVLVALLGAPAGAEGGCGAAFTWATIEEIRALRPQMPAGVAESIDFNGNGALCYMEGIGEGTPSPHAGKLNLVDDRAVAR